MEPAKPFEVEPEKDILGLITNIVDTSIKQNNERDVMISKLLNDNKKKLIGFG